MGLHKEDANCTCESKQTHNHLLTCNQMEKTCFQQELQENVPLTSRIIGEERFDEREESMGRRSVKYIDVRCTI